MLAGRTAHLFVEGTRQLKQGVAVEVDEGDQAAALRGAAQELDVGSRQRRFQHLEAGETFFFIKYFFIKYQSSTN